MATLVLQNMEIVGHVSGITIPPFPYTEGASEAFAVGAVLANDAGQADAAVDGSNTNLLMGIAKSAASGVTNDPVTIQPFILGTIIRVTLEDDTNENHAIIQGNIGTAFGLGVAGTNFYLDEDNTAVADTFARVTRLDEGSAIGDIRARVYAVVMSSFFSSTGA